MGSVGFEKLRVYRVAEQLADEILQLGSGGTPFAKNTVGEQVVRAADSLGQTSPKAPIEDRIETIVASFASHAVLCTKYVISFDARIGANFWLPTKFQNSSPSWTN